MAAADNFLKTFTLFGFLSPIHRWMERKKDLSAREEKDTRARLDFILEMMDAHPDAFASEEAVRSSALYFSGRF